MRYKYFSLALKELIITGCWGPSLMISSNTLMSTHEMLLRKDPEVCRACLFIGEISKATKGLKQLLRSLAIQSSIPMTIEAASGWVRKRGGYEALLPYTHAGAPLEIKAEINPEDFRGPSSFHVYIEDDDGMRVCTGESIFANREEAEGAAHLVWMLLGGTRHSAPGSRVTAEESRGMVDKEALDRAVQQLRTLRKEWEGKPRDPYQMWRQEVQGSKLLEKADLLGLLTILKEARRLEPAMLQSILSARIHQE